MSNQKVDLKQRGPVAWTLISLLVPFGLLIWFHRTRRQIDFLNQEAGRPQRLMNPWWLTGPLLALTGLVLLILIIVLIAAASSSASASQSGLDSQRLAEHNLTHDTPPVDDFGFDDEPDLYDDPSLLTSLSDDYSFDTEDEGEEFSVWGGLALALVYLLFTIGYIGYIVLLIIYLLKHVDGVTVLPGGAEDKTLLMVMAILGVVVLQPLIAFVVYKSQEIINRALDERAGSNSGGPIIA